MPTDRKAYARRYYLANKEKAIAQAEARRKADLPKYRAYAAAAKKRNPGRQLAYTRTYKYGLTRQEQDALFALPCPICSGKATVIDHDHLTGKVRGALCRACNAGLGMLKDDIALVYAAWEYLTTRA